MRLIHGIVDDALYTFDEVRTLRNVSRSTLYKELDQYDVIRDGRSRKITGTSLRRRIANLPRLLTR
jgi:hypothetical protein